MEVTLALVRTMEASLAQVVLWHEVTLDIEALVEYSDQEVFMAVMLWDDAVRIWPGPSISRKWRVVLSHHPSFQIFYLTMGH